MFVWAKVVGWLIILHTAEPLISDSYVTRAKLKHEKEEIKKNIFSNSTTLILVENTHLI